MARAKATNLQSHCNPCGGERTHVVLHRDHSEWSDDINDGRYPIWGTETYYLLRCAGCGAVHLRHQSTFSEHNPEDGPTVRYYPPAMSRRLPAWANDIVWPFGDENQIAIGDLIKEIYVALQNDSRRLAAMGIRALLEVVMIDKVGDQGAIGSNAKLFLEKGFVPAGMHDLFRDTMIEAGHASIHRNYVPTKADLDVLMDLTELLIASLYVHPAEAAKVRARIPKRGR